MKSVRTRMLVAAVALSLGLAGGVVPSALAAGTVKVGLSTALSGAVALLGQTNEHGIQLAIDKINADGGLLGKKIELVTADGETKPATGVTNVRNFVLSDQVKALFGPVSSAVGAAEAGVAAQYKVPIFMTTSNDIDQTGKNFSKYVFQVVPSTYMEPHAIAAYVARLDKQHHWKSYATISPDYSFGHSTVEEFLAGLKQDGVNANVVGEQWPALGASNFTPYISATMSKNPGFIFIGQYGGDLITLTKQGKGFGLFKKADVYAGYWTGVLESLAGDAPAGVISSDRARPFYMHPNAEMVQFSDTYHKKFGSWPTTWAVLGYAAVQTWAQGVKTAKSFDAGKVSAALSGATIKDTMNGTFKIRACDHQAEITEYVGRLSKQVDPKYNIRTMTDVYAPPPEKIMMTCKAKQALQHS